MSGLVTFYAGLLLVTFPFAVYGLYMVLFMEASGRASNVERLSVISLTLWAIILAIVFIYSVGFLFTEVLL